MDWQPASLWRTGSHASLPSSARNQSPTTTPFVPRANAQQPKLFVGMILILIFAEALALYGLIGE